MFQKGLCSSASFATWIHFQSAYAKSFGGVVGIGISWDFNPEARKASRENARIPCEQLPGPSMTQFCATCDCLPYKREDCAGGSCMSTDADATPTAPAQHSVFTLILTASLAISSQSPHFSMIATPSPQRQLFSVSADEKYDGFQCICPLTAYILHVWSMTRFHSPQITTEGRQWA